VFFQVVIGENGEMKLDPQTDPTLPKSLDRTPGHIQAMYLQREPTIPLVLDGPSCAIPVLKETQRNRKWPITFLEISTLLFFLSTL
jgi:hypothetical protein